MLKNVKLQVLVRFPHRNDVSSFLCKLWRATSIVKKKKTFFLFFFVWILSGLENRFCLLITAPCIAPCIAIISSNILKLGILSKCWYLDSIDKYKRKKKTYSSKVTIDLNTFLNLLPYGLHIVVSGFDLESTGLCGPWLQIRIYIWELCISFKTMFFCEDVGKMYLAAWKVYKYTKDKNKVIFLLVFTFVIRSFSLS